MAAPPLPQWNHSDECDDCRAVFGWLWLGRHHCRLCGRSLCAACLGPGRAPMPGLVSRPQRCCRTCQEEHGNTIALWSHWRGPEVATALRSSGELREWLLVLHERKLQWDPFNNDLNRLVRHGVCWALRATVWPQLLGVRVEADAGQLAEASRAAGGEHELLELDVARCADMNEAERDATQRLCAAVAPVAPYEQGTCFMAHVLLQCVPPQLAVGSLCALLTGSRLLSPRQGAWHECMEELVARKLPRLGPMLQRCGGVEASLLCHAWLRTSFAGFVPLSYCVRIWDCFFVHGFDYLLRCTLAMLTVAAPLLQDLAPNALLVAISPQRLPTLVCSHVSEDEFIEMTLAPL